MCVQLQLIARPSPGIYLHEYKPTFYHRFHYDLLIDEQCAVEYTFLSIDEVTSINKKNNNFLYRIERNELCFEEKTKELDEAWKIVHTSQHNLKLANDKVGQLKSRQNEIKHYKQQLQKSLDTSAKKMSAYIK